MPASFVWQPGSTGGTPLTDTNLNKLAVVADIGTAGTPTGDALKAALVPKWQPSTAYAAGDPVLNPSAQIATANTAHTSGTTYNSANWTVISGGGGGGVSLTAQNRWSASQYFLPPSGADVVANAFIGRRGGYSYGIDSAATIPSRDFFLGRNEPNPNGDDTDDFYISSNAQIITTAAALTAGATSLPLSSAPTFTGADSTGKYWVQIGDNTAGNTQEVVQITGGRGTATLTCSALAFPHPSGAQVTIGYDMANQSTFEFFRNSSAQPFNKNWRVTIRPDITGFQPNLGGLKIEAPGIGGTADLFRVASRDETQKAFRIQSDYSVSVESSPVDWQDAAGVTHATTTLGMSITPSDQMVGCFVSATGINRGTYITAVNVGAKTVTLSAAATTTATGVALYIYKPLFQVRQQGTDGYIPRLSVLGTSSVIRGKVSVGSAGAAGAGVPFADLTVFGTQIYMQGGGAYPDFAITLDTTGRARLQPWGVTAMSLDTGAGSTPRLGFFTANPVAQPTGTPAAATDLTTTTALANSIRASLLSLGLIA